MPSGTIAVDPAALDAAAQQSTELAADLRPLADAALAAARAAGAALAGWSLSGALAGIADSWQPALDGLAAELDANAAALHANSSAYVASSAYLASEFNAVPVSR